MTTERFFSSLAAILAAAFVLGVVVYFPPSFWSAQRLLAAGMVPASLALFAYTSRGHSTDVNLALTGITGFLCTAHLLVAARIFAFAIDDETNLTAVFCIANLAFGAVIALASGAAARIIAANIERNDTGGEFARLARDLALWAGNADDGETRVALLSLAEELRYFPRHIRQDGPLEHDVHLRAAAVGDKVRARDWAGARAALADLRRALESSRLSLQSRYSKV